MHIPDGFIDLKTVITTSVVSAGGLGYSIYKVKKVFKAKTIAIMGVLAAPVSYTHLDVYKRQLLLSPPEELT